MKILMLGAGHSQLNAIGRLKKMGHQVIVADYYANPPGKALADAHEQVSTFDVAANLEVARKHGVDGVMTLGTDQPVYTAVQVADALKLPAMLNVATAKAVTNKRIMKQHFVQNGLPTVAFHMLAKGFEESTLADLRFPVVVKPLDSQGQRGVYRLESPVEVNRRIDEVLAYSRESEILVEEYYPSDEITVSGWVVNDRLYVISIVDRIAYPDDFHIGVCIRHRFPSKYLETYGREIETLSRGIVKDFQIHNGPIYFQLLIGAEGIKINEIACRLGGAYEDEYLAQATGIDLLGMLIDSTLGQPVDSASLKKYDFTKIDRQISVELFFTRPGQVRVISDLKKLKDLPGVIQAKHHLKPGDICQPMENATARAGYVIITGRDTNELERNVRRVYQELGVYDGAGNNMVIYFA